MRWRKPPSSFILGTDRAWNKWDILVAEAYEIVQREKCPECGLPVFLCRSDDEHIQFKMKKTTCAAIEKKADWEKKHKSDKDTPGLSIRPEPYATDGRDLVEFREPYYRGLAARNEADLAS